jgi:hypothetical protein
VFYDQNPSYLVDRGTTVDEVRTAAAEPATDWKSFFARPVEIKKFKWSVGAALDQAIDPWDLWLKNTRVSNRISNYRSFSGTLKVKILLNGNNFYWGRALASYYPRYNSYSIFNMTDVSPMVTIPMSQRMHLWIDPTTSQGGEFTLPFFYEHDTLDLTSYNPLTVSLGTIFIKSIMSLYHASATDAIQFTMYAWCEDIELSGPTSQNISSILPQAGGMDEFSKKPVSTVANIVATASSKLVNIPGVGPWAMASQMAAKGIGQAADLLGYSRPIEISNNERRRVNNVGDLTTFDTVDTSQALSMAVKNELTISPTIAGLKDVDELSVEYLCAKESFLASASWSKSDADNKVLLSFPVLPGMYTNGTYTIPASTNALVMTPACAVQSMFSYWRGTVRFRVQIVASGYHKGRLTCYHDAKLAASVAEANVVQTRIVDIAEERDFYIDIPYMNPRGGLSCLQPAEMVGKSFSTTGTYTPFNLNSNGVFTISVNNSLVSSNASADPVFIIVSVSCHDMEFWQPSPYVRKLSIVPQSPLALNKSGPIEKDLINKESGDIAMSDDNSEVANASPEAEEGLQPLAGASPMGEKVAMIYSGERVHSLRSMIKRYGYNYSKVVSFPAIPTANSGQIYSYIEYTRSVPFFRGAAYPAVYLDDPGETYVTPLSYLIPWFAGYRGSVRTKIIPGLGMESVNSVYAFRTPSVTEDSLVTLTTTAGGVNPDGDVTFMMGEQMALRNVVANTKDGSNVLEVTNPFQYNGRFNVVDKQITGQVYASFQQGVGVTFTKGYQPGYEAAEHIVVLHKFNAAGDDFSLLFFNGIPPVWII